MIITTLLAADYLSNQCFGLSVAGSAGAASKNHARGC